jgi:hypothetical protein
MREQVVGVRRVAASALMAALVVAVAVLWVGSAGAGATCSPGRSGDHPNNGNHYGHDRRDHCRPPTTTHPPTTTTPPPTIVATTVPVTVATSSTLPPPSPPVTTPVQSPPTTSRPVAVAERVPTTDGAGETSTPSTPAEPQGVEPVDRLALIEADGWQAAAAQVLGITEEPPDVDEGATEAAAAGSAGTGGAGTTIPTEDRSNVATGLPETVDFSPTWVATNLGLGSLVLLVLLAAAQLFNDTLKTHHSQLVARLSDRSTIIGRARLALAALPHAPPLVSFAVIAATLGLLADPSVALSANTLAQVLGMSVGVVLIVGIYDGTASRTVNRQTGLVRGYRLYPIAIAVAVGCLALSRAFDIAPGVLYGLIAGVVYAGTVDRRLEGRAYALSSVLLMAAALGAYVVHRMVTPSAADDDPSFWVIIVDTAAAALFVGGLQAVIVQLLPVRYVNGEKISDWSRTGWFALLAVALGLYLQFVVRPNPDQQTWANLWFVAGLVGFAVLFWLWCTLSPSLRDSAEIGGASRAIRAERRQFRGRGVRATSAESDTATVTRAAKATRT